MNLIEIKNVYKQYKNGVTALSDVTVSIPKGDFVFVIGSTASGKKYTNKITIQTRKTISWRSICRRNKCF